ncbi:hypothetical protein C440_06632 [Haloferax mucosum ATCC BAA-1512]|uniref:Uncharacterized protein n=1 Tax=Haloferax mucosum ATCC BAA-1512 TaxID=662479 RepID=M0IGN8_9EURY|nr:hypothetical protein [Haloferax mucosum]ELZ95945.1 hypothetical protein C440_06632 [Haloferax mucosum ATCC BAA-1512]
MTPEQGGHTPLSPQAKRAFEHLQPLIREHDSGMPVADARQQLQAAEQDADAIDELLNKGYLYEVEGRVYVT